MADVRQVYGASCNILGLTKMNIGADCPFCRNRILIYETTNQEQRKAGLVYLKTKCSKCNAIIEAAGIGEVDAINEMEENIKKRVGTFPGRWLIKPKKEKGRYKK